MCVSVHVGLGVCVWGGMGGGVQVGVCMWMWVCGGRCVDVCDLYGNRQTRVRK